MDPAVLLARAELFRALDADVVQKVAGDARTVTLQRNDLIFSEGDAAAELYVVRSGRIAIAKRATDGRESVVALMEEGDLIGEMSLFDGKGRSADARALEPSELVAVPFASLRAIFDERPRLLWVVVQLLVDRLRST